MLIIGVMIMNKGDKMTDILVNLIQDIECVKYNGFLKKVLINKKIKRAKNKMFLNIKTIKSYHDTDILNICMFVKTAKALNLFDIDNIRISLISSDSYSDNDTIGDILGSIDIDIQKSKDLIIGRDGEWLEMISISSLYNPTANKKGIKIKWTTRTENNDSNIFYNTYVEEINMNGVEIHIKQDLLYNSTYWILYNIYTIIVENIMMNLSKRWLYEKT